jgi:hypothetical protein
MSLTEHRQDAQVLRPWRAQVGPQLEAVKKHWVSELFFGGAVGGGKSDYLLGDYGQDVASYGSAWRGILFRKSFPQLEEIVARSKEIFPAWFGLDADKCWTSGNHTWTFPNGATLKFRHAEDDDAWMSYQGHQYSWMGYDELPHWDNPSFYRQMKTRLRSAAGISNMRIRGTGNPGGLGHGWIKDYFAIDRYPMGSVLIPKDKAGGARMFVRSKVTDNKILLANDPEYIDRLAGLGSEALVQMYLAGDWNVIAGAFFPEFSVDRHVLAPFPIPQGWTKCRAMDWGSAAPFSVGWYAVSDGQMFEASINGETKQLWFPRGALIKYREWYGMKPGENNVGLKLDTEEVADGIREREKNDGPIDLCVIDPSAMKTDGGPSHAERMGKRKVHFQKADNNRRAGWDMLRARLKGNGDGDAMIYFFSTCEHTIRTVPMLQHDRGKAVGAVEDVDSAGEDHAGDETRYMCMARPWVRPGTPVTDAPKFSGVIGGGNMITFQDAVKLSRRRRLQREGKL